MVTVRVTVLTVMIRMIITTMMMTVVVTVIVDVTITISVTVTITMKFWVFGRECRFGLDYPRPDEHSCIMLAYFLPNRNNLDPSQYTEVPVKFQSDRTIINTNLAASRL